MFKTTLFALLLATLVPAAEVPERIKQQNEKYGSELEAYFRDYLVTKYPERAAKGPGEARGELAADQLRQEEGVFSQRGGLPRT